MSLTSHTFRWSLVLKLHSLGANLNRQWKWSYSLRMMLCRYPRARLTTGHTPLLRPQSPSYLLFWLRATGPLSLLNPHLYPDPLLSQITGSGFIKLSFKSKNECFWMFMFVVPRGISSVTEDCVFHWCSGLFISGWFSILRNTWDAPGDFRKFWPKALPGVCIQF